jgi:AAA family ATP:ADP antiporter
MSSPENAAAPRGNPSLTFAAGEKLPAFLAFALYFCVLGGYFAVRPVRDTIGSILGRERVGELFLHTWIASLAIVPLYGWLCTKFRRQAFLPWIYGFVALALAGCASAFLLHREGNVLVGEFFYVMISVLNLFIVSVMWSFLLELFTTAQTKRLFGFIAAGGTTGALAGPWLTSHLVKTIGNGGVLFLGAGLFVAAIVLQRILLKAWQQAPWRNDAQAAAERERPLGGNPFAGVWLVLKSPGLLGIAVYVLGISAVNTFLYFDQLDLLPKAYPDPAERTQVLGQIDFTVQSLTVLLQVFATGRLASRWGLPVLLTIVPVLMIAAMSTLAALHTFAVLVTVIIIRRVGEYAFVRPGREMLYSPLGAETKYKAKNFIDVPVYRGGDWITGKLGNMDLKGLSTAAIGAGVAILWAGTGWWLGRRAETEAAKAAKAG